MTLLLSACSGSEDETCEPVVASPIDEEERRHAEGVELAELQACWSRVEKGITLECIADAEGRLYAGVRGLAAEYRGSLLHGAAGTAACTETLARIALRCFLHNWHAVSPLKGTFS